MSDRIHRRHAIAGALAIASFVTAAFAQNRNGPVRIGFLSGEAGPNDWFDGLRKGMAALGYEDRDFVIDARYVSRRYDQILSVAEELIKAGAVILVTAGPATLGAPQASKSVPVVFVFSGDPVDAGFVESFARPGRNITGVSLMQLALSAKRVELLKEAAPGVRRPALLWNPNHPGAQSELRATLAAAEKLELTFHSYEVRSDANFAAAFVAIERDACNSLLSFPEGLTLFNRKRIAEFALARRIPSVFGWKQFAEEGALIAYGPDLAAAYARSAYFVDRILKGKKAADLPIEQPTHFELIVNLKTAQAIGLTVPPSIMVRADQTIA